MIHPIRDEDINWAEHALGKHIGFDEEAREFIRDLDSLHLVACPGSGKTTALIAKLLILSRNLPLEGNRGICILTHTNVAVEQVRKGVGSLGQSLFSYPNFCGTFQSFVGRFLGYPAYVEKFGHRPITVDNEVATRDLRSKESQAWTKALYALKKKRIEVDSLVFDSELQITKKGNDGPFMNPTRDAYQTIKAAKLEVLKRGHLFYHDVFVFAERHLERHPEIVGVFPKRFPYVFVDEMQDTDERQTKILNYLFSNEDAVLQRVGDPNQAIYNHSSVGEACVWRPAEQSPKLSTSRRFGTSIATVVSNLAVVSPVPVLGCANTENIKPYLIVFPDSRIEEVIPTFADLVTEHGLHELPQKQGFKAVGWVGKEHASKHTLPNYWPQFEMMQNRRTSSYATLKGNLHSASLSGDFSSPKAFKDALVTGILGMLTAGGAETEKGKRFTKTSFLAHLREYDKDALVRLERETARWCLRWKNGEDVFYEVCEFLRDWLPASFGVDVDDIDVASYLASDEETVPTQPSDSVTNGYEFEQDIIDVSTVHAVKSETHTATLLLETFYYGYDMHRILPYLKGRTVTGNEGERVKKSLKVAFVACSRPTHLLAVAIHAETTDDRNKPRLLTSDDLTELETMWEIRDLR